MEFTDVNKAINDTPIGIFENKSTSFKLIAFIALAVAGVCLFSFISILLMIPIAGVNLLTEPFALSNTNDAKVINAYKLLQLGNQLGLFIVPALVAAKLFGGNVFGYLKLNKLPSSKIVLATIALILLALPGINLLGYLNSILHLPNFMSGIETWMHTKETEAEVLTKLFLKTSSVMGLLLNIFIVALMAAVGEELFFRGIIQRLLSNKYARRTIAVWVTAIVFSAIHMQFFGFFPRMLIGAVLGFLFLWTNNLWIPIIAHFTNNASAVLMSYATQQGVLTDSAEQIGATQNDYIIGVASIVITLVLLYMFKNKFEVNEVTQSAVINYN
ncbi:MAG: CPBP family intramembrane metalloprotease [Bacteroidia bacterium]|nr:CPBP family intramembrane metalloprotease [Bacteroidia bacterium]